MQLNSLPFLFYFLPVMVLVYFLIPARFRMAALAAGSLVFYWFACGGKPLPFLMLIALTLFSYFAGILLFKKRKRLIFAAVSAVPVAALIFFKYFGGGRYLPAGMSFYVFQMLAYFCDISRGEMLPESDIVNFGASVVMFPKVLSGPICPPGELKRQTRAPQVTLENLHLGLQDLIAGLAIKVLLSDKIAGVWARAGVVGYESLSVPFAWLALFSFAFRLYFDFWGYSMMAVGLGRMLGFELPENFLQPYSSRSVSEFFRRWHASLGAWFKKYIYIPLGGNRHGTARMILSLAAVWLLTGLWHGNGLGFLIWAGMIFGVIVGEKLRWGKFLERHKVFSHVYTVTVILISWVPFAAGAAGGAATLLGRLFGIGGYMPPRDVAVFAKSYIVPYIFCFLFATPLPDYLWKKARGHFVTDIALFPLFWYCVYTLATSASNPFYYFQF